MVFVDSSAFYAAADNQDRSNARAKELLLGAGSLVTTDHVLVETWLLMQRRVGIEAADRFWDQLRRGAAMLERVLPADLEGAWRIGQHFADQAFSIVDRTSFAVMERLGITRAVSFDDDFLIYRYGPRRSRAFEVLR